METLATSPSTGVPSALRPGARERVPSLVYMEATARPAIARAQTQRRRHVARLNRRRIVTAPSTKPVDTISPFSPRLGSPTTTFSPLELLFTGTPLPSPYSFDSLKSIDSVLSSSVRSVVPPSSPSGRNVDSASPPELVVGKAGPSNDLSTRVLGSSLSAPPDPPSSIILPLAIRTTCDLKAEHERYAKAMLRAASLESTSSDPTGAPSAITRSSTTGSQREGAALPALSVIRFARAPSRIPRLQRESTDKSTSSSKFSRTPLARQTSSDSDSSQTVVNDREDIFTIKSVDASQSAACQTLPRENSFTKSLQLEILAPPSPVEQRLRLRSGLPSLPDDIADLATADSYLSALEALLGVTPPRSNTTAVPEFTSDADTDSEILLTPTIDVRISVRLASVASHDRAAARKALDFAAISHIGALEAHLETLAARFPFMLDAEATNAREDKSLDGDERMRIWLADTGAVQGKDGHRLPRLEGHLDTLLMRVEQRMLLVD